MWQLSACAINQLISSMFLNAGLEMGDFAVIDFEGSSNGKPISEIAPQASKNLHGGKKFWLRLASDNFLPKFCEQMVGQKPSEARTVTVDFRGGFSR